MRYDKCVEFISESQKKYVPGKGYQGDVVTITKNANVTELGISRSVQLFGEIKTGQKIVRLPNSIGQVWTYVLIGDKKYKPVTELNTSKGYAVVVGESYE